MLRLRFLVVFATCICSIALAQQKPFSLSLQDDTYGRRTVRITTAKPMTAFLLGEGPTQNPGDQHISFYFDSAVYYIDWALSPEGGTTSFNLSSDRGSDPPTVLAVVFLDGTSYGDSAAVAAIVEERKRIASDLDDIDRMLQAGATLSQIQGRLARRQMEAELEPGTTSLSKAFQGKLTGARYWLEELAQAVSGNADPRDLRAMRPERAREVFLQWQKRLKTPAVTAEVPQR